MQPDWRESEFGGFVERLEPLIGRESGGLVLGAGVCFLGGPAPLVLGNAEHWEPGSASRPQILPVAEAGPLSELAADVDLPPESVVLFVDPPQPLGTQVVKPGLPIRGQMRGTLGACLPAEFCPRLEPPCEAVYMTAGHVVGAPGSAVEELTPRRLFPDQHRPLGTVRYKRAPEPFGPPEYDIALISALGPSEHCQVASLGLYQSQPVPTTIFGGVSGIGFGGVIGALGPYSDELGRLNWKNSWVMFPGRLGAEGDSGSTVETCEGSVLGILVGGSKVKGRDEFSALFVQDLEAVVVDLFM